MAVDLIAYSSSGLVVGGVLCYPDDGGRHSAVVHLHGGLGGIFDDPEGRMLETCFNWAHLHGRTAFVPSFRGQDGGEGVPELCLGEADDVIAGVVLLRSLEMTEAGRVGLVGGSVGGCVALRAAPRIPDLRAVVAYVPPTDWKALLDYHRTLWAPAGELLCDGGTRPWTTGGPDLADAFDQMICGYRGCPDTAYEARSPLPGVLSQSAPTLVVTAEADNVVPVDQQLLWSVYRQASGHPVEVRTMAPCDPPQAPPFGQDVLLHLEGGYHLLSPGSISSGLLFLLDALDH